MDDRSGPTTATARSSWTAASAASFALAGSGAREALNGLVTNEVETLEPGHGAVRRRPHAEGQDDRRPARPGDGERAAAGHGALALQAIFDVLRHGLVGYEAEIGKRTLECGLLSLIGTGAVRLAGAEALPAEEHAHAEVAIGGLRARVVRTDRRRRPDLRRR